MNINKHLGADNRNYNPHPTKEDFRKMDTDVLDRYKNNSHLTIEEQNTIKEILKERGYNE